MKIFITLAALILGIPLFIQTKSLQEKPLKYSQQENYASSCRKRKTKKNRAVYRASSPTSTDITQEKTHPIITPKGHKENQENCSSKQFHTKKNSTLKNDAPANADVGRPALQSKTDGVEPIALAQTRTQNNQKENKSYQAASPTPTMESPLGKAEIALNKQEAPIAQPDTRTIIIKNGITKKMRTYKHWGTSHEPAFTLRVNGIEIPQEGQIPVEITNNELTADYHANFYGGMRTSADKTSFIVDSDTSEITISFGWDKNPRIVIDSATVVQEK